MRFTILEEIKSTNRTQTNENELFSCGMFLGLKKAFNIVGHSILLHKLHQHGIRDIMNDWSSSYLPNRFQASQIDSYFT